MSGQPPLSPGWGKQTQSASAPSLTGQCFTAGLSSGTGAAHQDQQEPSPSQAGLQPEPQVKGHGSTLPAIREWAEQ